MCERKTVRPRVYCFCYEHTLDVDTVYKFGTVLCCKYDYDGPMVLIFAVLALLVMIIRAKFD